MPRAGRFEEAIATAQKGFELARAANDRRFAGILPGAFEILQSRQTLAGSP
jgi:hypothetical protein